MGACGGIVSAITSVLYSKTVGGLAHVNYLPLFLLLAPLCWYQAIVFITIKEPA